MGGEAGLKRSLGLGSLVFYGIAFMVPLTIFTTYGLVAARTRGMVAAAYIVATLGMTLIALSYAAMAKAFPAAGSVYTYALKSFGPRVGFLSGWVLLLGYAFLPALNCLASAIFLSALFPRLPPWIWTIAFTAFVIIVNLRGITLADRIDRAIVVLQIAFLVVFACLAAGSILKAGPVAASAGQGTGIAALLSGSSILALSFLGFDAVSTLSEEAVAPERDLPRAMLFCCAGAGLCFTLLSFLMQAAWPEAWREMKSPDGGSYELIERIGGSALGYVFIGAYAIGCLASSTSSVASASRLLYGMGRDGAIPKAIFGHLGRRRGMPTYNILIVGCLCLASLRLSLTTAVSLLNFGALLAFAVVNLAVIARRFIRDGLRKGLDLLRYLIAPALGAAISLALWVRLDALAMRLGFSWIALGFAYLAVSTRFFRKRSSL
jgi:amino acid transporter